MTATPFELHHPSGITVSRTLSEMQLLSSHPEVAGSRRDMRTGWIWYSLPPFTDDEVIVATSLAFNHGAIELVELSDASKNFGSSWADWSEEKAIQRAASISAWLAKNGYPTGTYSWGSVWAGYDPRSGDGFASVRYVTQQAIQCGKQELEDNS